jgi:predicted dehydrogenase
MVTVRANVGYIPPEVWVHDPEQGGGNIIGEACHFFELIQAITNSHPVSVYAQSLKATSRAVVEEDNVIITLTMANGSIGTIIYTALGDKAWGRERVEIFGGGAVCEIDNFKTLTFSQGGKRKHIGNLLSGVDRDGKPFPVNFEDYVRVTRATFAARESLRTGTPQTLS